MLNFSTHPLVPTMPTKNEYYDITYVQQDDTNSLVQRAKLDVMTGSDTEVQCLVDEQILNKAIELSKQNDYVAPAGTLNERIAAALKDNAFTKSDDVYCIVPENFNEVVDARLFYTDKLTDEIVVSVKQHSNEPGLVLIYQPESLQTDNKQVCVVPVGFFPQKRFVKIAL